MSRGKSCKYRQFNAAINYNYYDRISTLCYPKDSNVSVVFGPCNTKPYSNNRSQLEENQAIQIRAWIV